MIQLQLDEKTLAEIRIKHLDYFNSVHLRKLVDRICNTSGLEQNLYIFFHNNLNDILTGKPKELRNVIEALKREPFSKLVFSFDLEERHKKCIKLRNEIPSGVEVIPSNRDDTLDSIKAANSIFPIGARVHDLNVSKTRKLASFSRKKLIAVRNDLRKEIFDRKNSIKPLLREISQVFNYESFSSSNDSWGAYELTEKVNTKTCPYCNRIFTHTFISNNGKTRAELDHFYPKSIYPFLGLSLFNLVPCCHVCNSSFKGNKDFFHIPHIHPYEESFGDKGVFSTDFIKDKNGEYDLSLFKAIGGEYFKLNFVNKHNCQKILESNNTFKIEKLYQNHKDYVNSIIWKAIAYNDGQLDDFKKLFAAEEVETFIGILMGNYIEEADVGNHALGKLTRDICKEFGII
jgi:5-methylcytosine-specific restriction endonuclease McrA